MKASIFTLSLVLSLSATAGESYSCQGKNEDKKEAKIELSFENQKSVKVTDTEGEEITLDLQKTTQKGTLYADYTYDGYGGSIELKLPKNFTISGTNAAEEFKATYVHETYSELGHVYTAKFVGTCQRLDN